MTAVNLLRRSSAAARLALVACCIVMASCGGGGGGGEADQTRTLDPRLTAVVQDIVGTLDPAAPGRGPTDYPVTGAADIPKAYAMVIKAAILDAGRTPRLRDLANTSEQWLVSHADDNADGVKGWGLPFAWDAFGDGTTNPADTEYAITTAIVIDALLDRAAVTSGTSRTAFLDLCIAAMRPYLDPAIRTGSGTAPYSLTLQDRAWDVFNTAAYVAAMAQRLSNAAIDPAASAALRAFADLNMQFILDQKLVSADGAWYWPYLLPGTSVNDLPHAAYIAYSIERYRREGGALGSSFDMAAIWKHFRAFLVPGADYVRAYPTFVAIDGPARSYDVGFALATLSLLGDPVPDVREQLIAVLSTYRLVSGHYAKYPVTGSARVSDVAIVTEYETYFLFAASAALANTNVVNSLYGPR